MRRNPVTEVAYQVIDSRHRIVNKRKIFKTEAAMRKYFVKLEKDGHLHQILGYRKNPVLEILGTAAATGLGFGVGMKLLDKISEDLKKKKINPIYTKSGRLVVFPELLTTMRTVVPNPKDRMYPNKQDRPAPGKYYGDFDSETGQWGVFNEGTEGFCYAAYLSKREAQERARILNSYKRDNPVVKVHPKALESLKRYQADLKAGHKDAAEYWRGQAGAYFTANPGAEWHRRRIDELRNLPSFADPKMWILENAKINENKFAADMSQRLGISNPRPPSQWWANTYPRVRASYPGASRERLSRITAGIWWNLPESTRNPGAEWHGKQVKESLKYMRRQGESEYARGIRAAHLQSARASWAQGLPNPRPPAQWWANTYPRVRASYPGASRERLSRITAGIWWNLPESTRKRLIKRYD